MRIGIDLGGSKIEGLALADDGQEILRFRRPTPSGDYLATLETIRELCLALEQEGGQQGSIGIGTPGSPSPSDGLMRNANSVCLNGKPLLRDLEQILRRPVRMANDADCFTLSEAMDGSAAEADSVFGVILGTGTGGGICINRHLVCGPNAVAGEWGHNPLPWPDESELPGPNCYCGKRGCIETFLSGPGLEREYSATSGRKLDANEIAALAEEGDSTACRIMQQYETRLAKSLASVINILDPEIIVLGGGLSNVTRLYRNVPALWKEFVFSDTVVTRLVPPMHGDSSGVRGAAWLWPL